MSPLVDDDRAGSKWDRAARFMRIATILHGHGEAGVSVDKIAELVGVSKRTVYRDLKAMELDAALPVWQQGGKWGLEAGAFLPPLALTLDEAMALFLSARVMVKTSDEQDTELIGAFVKLASVVPPVLAEHVQASADVFAAAPRDEVFTRVYRTLTRAWAERRVVEIEYGPGVYDPSKQVRRTRVRPYLIEPSALTHALYLIGWDEDRRARRTFKVERILSASLTPDAFEPEPGFDLVRELSRGWDVIADEPMESVVLRFSPAVAKRAAETRWHPSQQIEEQPDGSLLWRGYVSGLREIRIWILGWGADVAVLEPGTLRDEVAAELARAAEQYGRD